MNTNQNQTSELRSRIIGLEMIDWQTMDFIQNDNFKVSSKEQYKKVVSSLVNNQFVAPFYVWQDKAGKYWCVDGKRRDTVLRQIQNEGGATIHDPATGEEKFVQITIPAELPALVIEAESKEEAAKLVLLYSSGYGEVTQEGLAKFIKDYDLNFPELKFEISLPEFSMPRFEQAFDMMGLDNGKGNGEPYAEEHEDFTPENEAETIVQRGDVYELNGKHRLVCGDSLLAETFETLMNGILARIIITDPPYNIPYSLYGGLGKIRHDDFAMATGEMSNHEFVEFLATYMSHTVKNSVDGSIHFHFMDFRHIWHMCQAAAKETTYKTNEPKQVCVWNKSIQANGSFYRAKHEFCFIFKSGTEKHLSHLELKDRFRSNVWDYKSANDFSNDERKEFGRLGALENHPTPKPVRMIADAILDTTNEGDVVLDCFLGSGTTLMAAERTKRICHGIEYEPGYMQGILTRFINHCQTEGKPFEIKKNGEVISAEELAPLMPE